MPSFSCYDLHLCPIFSDPPQVEHFGVVSPDYDIDAAGDLEGDMDALLS